MIDGSCSSRKAGCEPVEPDRGLIGAAGHATGGTVVMARVYEKDGKRRIGMVGEASFAD